MNKNKALSTLILSIMFTGIAFIARDAFINRNKANDVIEVTGHGNENFQADLIVWNALFSRQDYILSEAYSSLKYDRDRIESYLLQKGIAKEEIIFSSADIEKKYEWVTEGEREWMEFRGYKLDQHVKIESHEVEKIEKISRDITSLIHSGIELDSENPDYFYTGLSELKIQMIAKATEDARTRAEKIATNTKAKLGKLKSARMGVFQITSQYSNEEYTWGGAYSTASRDKTASITVKARFGIK